MQKERRKGCWREKERILDVIDFKPLDCLFATCQTSVKKGKKIEKF